LQSDFLQGFFHFVELERLDDGLDLFHAHPCYDLASPFAGRMPIGIGTKI
jgi:hypothetical protein